MKWYILLFFVFAIACQPSYKIITADTSELYLEDISKGKIDFIKQDYAKNNFDNKLSKNWRATVCKLDELEILYPMTAPRYKAGDISFESRAFVFSKKGAFSYTPQRTAYADELGYFELRNCIATAKGYLLIIEEYHRYFNSLVLIYIENGKLIILGDIALSLKEDTRCGCVIEIVDNKLDFFLVPTTLNKPDSTKNCLIKNEYRNLFDKIL